MKRLIKPSLLRSFMCIRSATSSNLQLGQRNFKITRLYIHVYAHIDIYKREFYRIVTCIHMYVFICMCIVRTSSHEKTHTSLPIQLTSVWTIFVYLHNEDTHKTINTRMYICMFICIVSHLVLSIQEIELEAYSTLGPRDTMMMTISF